MTRYSPVAYVPGQGERARPSYDYPTGGSLYDQCRLTYEERLLFEHLVKLTMKYTLTSAERLYLGELKNRWDSLSIIIQERIT